MNYDDFIDKKQFNEKFIVPALKQCGYNKEAKQIHDCGVGRYYAKCKICGAYHFNGVMSCKNRLCAVCQKKRSLLWYMRMYPILKHYLVSGNKVVFVTFTIKNTERLSDGLDYLQQGFRYLTAIGNKITKAFKYLFVGGVRSIEIKRGKNSGLWHPHAHCLFIKREDTQFRDDAKFLMAAWNTVLCTVHGEIAKWGSVDYKAIQGVKDIDTGCKAICETFKYATKFDWQNDAKDIPEIMEALKGRRLIVPFGSVKDMLNESSIEHDMILPYTEIKKRFCAVCGSDKFDEFYTCEYDTIRNANIFDFETMGE